MGSLRKVGAEPVRQDQAAGHRQLRRRERYDSGCSGVPHSEGKMIDKLRPALIAVVVTVLVLLQPFSPGWAQSQINYAWDPTSTIGGVWGFQAVQPDFKPTDISGLQLWLSADNVDGSNNSTLSDGNAVATWTDLSGNGNHATQATGANQPLFKTGIVNGKPVVRFDGSNDYLSLSGTALNMARNIPGITMFAVLQTTKPGSIRRVFSISVNAILGSTRAVMAHEQVGGNLGGGGRRLDSDTYAIVAGGSFTAGVYFIEGLVLDYANALASAYKDGSLVVSTNPFQTAGSTSDTASAGIAVGALPDGTSSINGDIAEIIAYNRALTTAERRNLTGRTLNEYIVSATSPALGRTMTPGGTITLSSGSRTPSLYSSPGTFPTRIDSFGSGNALRFNGTDEYLTSVITRRKVNTDTLNHLVDSAAAIDFSDNVEVGDEVVDTVNGDKCVVTAVADGDLTLDGDCFAAGTESYEIQSGGLRPTTAMTVEAVIKMETSGTLRDIASKQGAWRFGVDSNDRLFLEVIDSDSSTVTSSSGPTLTLNKRYDVAGTYDGTTLSVHVDGGNATTATFAGGIRDSIYPFVIGALNCASGFFQGIIDDVRLTGSAESQAVIRARHMKRQGRHWYVTR